MENSDSYSEVMGQANLFRNANFSALQQKANMYIDKQKDEKDEIEGVTMPLEIPLIDKFGGRVGKRVMKKLGMESEEDDGLMKTLAKKGLNSLLEKAGLKKPDAKPTKPDGDDKDEPTEDAKPTEDTKPIEDAVEDEDTSFEGVKNRFKKLSDDDKDDIRNNLENNSEFTDKETLDSLPDTIREASQLKNTSLLNDEVKQKEAQGEEETGEKVGQEAEDALGDEPELLSGVKSAVSDAKGAISDATDTGLSSITSGVKSALSDAKSAVSDATTGIKDTVTTGIKDAISGGGKSLAEKLAAKSAEVEAEGGGPEDIGGDIVSAGLAIGAMFASIFGKHIKHPDIQTQEPTLVATQGYGLAEQ